MLRFTFLSMGNMIYFTEEGLKSAGKSIGKVVSSKFSVYFNTSKRPYMKLGISLGIYMPMEISLTFYDFSRIQSEKAYFWT